jgi:DNA-binding transcriptional regulator LsrR (DeoR family)
VAGGYFKHEIIRLIVEKKLCNALITDKAVAEKLME